MENYIAPSQIGMKKKSISKGLPLDKTFGSETCVGRLLIDAAEKDQGKGITFIKSNNQELFLSYGEILKKAAFRLGALNELGVKKGQAAILVLDDNIDFVLDFWACMLGGIIPVPISYPVSILSKNAALEKLGMVYRLLDNPFVLSDERMADNSNEMNSFPGIKDMRIIISSRLDESNINGRIESPDASMPAIYQFSSGSTSAPKGVILTHKNLLSNIEAITSCAGILSEDIVLSWMPMHHDMGLVGFLLTPSVKCANIINMEPKSFIKNPALLLDLTTKRRVTVTGSPNFGYNLILKKVTEKNINSWDLSSLRIIFHGAEPISAKTMEEFTERLSSCGLSKTSIFPVYGMAEACLAVSFPPRGSEPLVHSLNRKKLAGEFVAENCDKSDENSILLVDEGYPVKGTCVRIVDNEGKIVPERIIGEIHITGDSVTSGYIGRPDITEVSFQDGWLKTGDMGFLSDGRLTVTGRIKDIIFINGQNFFAHDIERKIEEIEGVDSNKIAVCSWHDSEVGCERTALFSAIRNHKDDKGFYAKILRHVNENLSITLDYIILIRNIPKTTSGKVQRHVLVKDYIEGIIPSTVLNASDLLYEQGKNKHLDSRYGNLIRQIWADVLERQVEDIPADVSFLSLGGTSVKAVQVLNGLESSLNTTLSYDILTQCRTIMDMEEYLLKDADCNAVKEEKVSNIPDYRHKLPGFMGEDIAVISMACRFPDASTPEMFWNNVSSGKCSIRDIPPERFDLRQLSNYKLNTEENICLTGAFIENPYDFDAKLFNIADEEAAVMDPQQRIILELVLELFERAGYTRECVNGKNIGVFIGAGTNAYNEYHLLTQAFQSFKDFDSIKSLTSEQQMSIFEEWKTKFGVTNTHSNVLVDNILNMIAARASQEFNLKGPAMVIDTACSSSLAALHLACESIRNGECDSAIAGGISLLLTATPYIHFNNAGVLSRSGQLKAFDEKADGLVPGEGAGIVMLKPLSKALTDEDEIHAVIKLSAMNNDGHSIGVMTPNPDGQRNVIEKVYEKSGISPLNVKYVEAQGTGTIIGDLSEVRALSLAFDRWKADKGSIALGTVKSNIGHLLCASGIAGFIKVVLGLKNKKIPPVVNVTTPNPVIRFEETPFYLAQKPEAWESVKGIPRMAAINSFGFGGTNCHLVLEEAPEISEEIEISERKQSWSAARLYDRKTYMPDFGSFNKGVCLENEKVSQFYEGKLRENTNFEEVSDMERTIYQIIANQLEISINDLNINNNFFELGLDSMKALGTINEIQSQLKIKLYPTLIFEYQTPGALAGYIEKSYTACD